MTLVDTHAHAYHARFDEDREAMLERARAVGVTRIVLPNIDASSIDGMLALADAHPGFCLPAMGVHPCSIGETAEAELATAERWLFDPPRPLRFWAVGEIGLDWYWDTSHAEAQRAAFARQLGWARTLDLPVIIHSRDSLDDCLDLVEAAGGVRGVFHCFSGSAEQAARAVSLGFLLGIGGVATFKNGGLDRVLPGVPLEHLVLETDAPYLAPVPHRGKRNEPAYVALVAERLASWYGTTAEAVGKATSANAARLFGW